MNPDALPGEMKIQKNVKRKEHQRIQEKINELQNLHELFFFSTNWYSIAIIFKGTLMQI